VIGECHERGTRNDGRGVVAVGNRDDRVGLAVENPRRRHDLGGIERLSVRLSEGEGSDTTGPRPGSTLLTYTEFRPGSGQIFPSRNLGCKRSKIISEDHNMLFTWENVELRGLEPLASCMPCKRSTN
jgi:hypothetical protein